MQTSSLTKQRGFLLLEAVIYITLWMVFAVYAGKATGFWINKTNAEGVGNKLAVYNVQVGSFILKNMEKAVLEKTDPDTLILGDHEGVEWLQEAATCPNGTGEFRLLPCQFDSLPLPWGLTWKTSITKDGEGFYKAETTLGEPTPQQEYGKFAGIIAMTAKGFGGGQADIPEMSKWGIARYEIDGGDDDTANIVKAYLDLTVKESPFLDRNGNNSMLGDLNMGGHDINHASTVRVTRNVLIDSTDINLAGSSQSNLYVYSGNTIPKPVCPSEMVPHITPFPAQIYDSSDENSAIYAVDIKTVDEGAQWRITILLMSEANAEPHPASSLSTAKIGITCVATGGT
jgi:hypothetical protein